MSLPPKPKPKPLPVEILKIISSYNKIPFNFPTKGLIVVHFPFEGSDLKNYNELYTFFSEVSDDETNWFYDVMDSPCMRGIISDDDNVEELIIILTPFYTVRNFIGFRKDVEKIAKQMEIAEQIEDSDSEANDMSKLWDKMDLLIKESGFKKICEALKTRSSIIYDDASDVSEAGWHANDFDDD